MLLILGGSDFFSRVFLKRSSFFFNEIILIPQTTGDCYECFGQGGCLFVSCMFVNLFVCIFLKFLCFFDCHHLFLHVSMGERVVVCVCIG